MKRFLIGILALFSASAGATTLNPVQLLNPAGSTAGQAIVSNGASAAPTWQAVPMTGVTGVLPIANGGTNASTASGTSLDNITGFASTGFLTRTGAGAYAFQSLTNGITLGNLAQAAANTVLANATGSTANVTALAVPSCSATGSALLWTSATGFGCATGYAPLASPTFTGSPAAPTAAAGTATTQLATTAFVTTSPTINQPTINGVTNASSAGAGVVGQVLTASASAVSISNSTAANCTSVNLTAGDWDVWGNNFFNPGSGASFSLMTSSLSTTSATHAASPDVAQQAYAGTVNFGQSLQAPIQIINVSGSTTVYLVATGGFSGGTATVTCKIYARRVR